MGAFVALLVRLYFIKYLDLDVFNTVEHGFYTCLFVLFFLNSLKQAIRFLVYELLDSKLNMCISSFKSWIQKIWSLTSN